MKITGMLGTSTHFARVRDQFKPDFDNVICITGYSCSFKVSELLYVR